MYIYIKWCVHKMVFTYIYRSWEYRIHILLHALYVLPLLEYLGLIKSV